MMGSMMTLLVISWGGALGSIHILAAMVQLPTCLAISLCSLRGVMYCPHAAIMAASPGAIWCSGSAW